MSERNILRGETHLYTAAVGSEIPVDLVGAELGSASTDTDWTHFGFSLGGATFNYTEETFDFRVDQKNLPVDDEITSKTVTLGISAAEYVPSTLKRMVSGSVEAGTTNHSITHVSGKDRRTEEMVLLVNRQADGTTVFWVGYVCKSSGQAALTFVKGQQAVPSITWKAFEPGGDLDAVDIMTFDADFDPAVDWAA